MPVAENKILFEWMCMPDCLEIGLGIKPTLGGKKPLFLPAYDA